jgi:biotin transporter BioY
VPAAAVVAVTSRLLFIVGDVAWSAVAVLAARRIHHRSGSARR